MSNPLTINEFNELEVEALYIALREGLSTLPADNAANTQNY